MIEDVKLTENFSLFELTRTNKVEFQDINRILTDQQIMKLGEVARLLERVRTLFSVPITVSSGYRCPSLNKAVGSSDRSQHLLCEAADFIPKGLDVGEAFRDLWSYVKKGDLNVGQLIHETAERGNSFVSWIHISLGVPFRPIGRCNQILRMEHGKFTLLSA